ncbi:MAG: hypothetical protein MZV49_06000 [Rhodopseudomonas palustris]|nr:hypothetical protein [Rhodopseudomonas palustris]
MTAWTRPPLREPTNTVPCAPRVMARALSIRAHSSMRNPGGSLIRSSGSAWAQALEGGEQQRATARPDGESSCPVLRSVLSRSIESPARRGNHVPGALTLFGAAARLAFVLSGTAPGLVRLAACTGNGRTRR